MILIDPPSGWMYGFPKAVTKEEYHKISNLKEWCISNGYPQKEADSYGDYFHIGITGDISTPSVSIRSKALSWWSKLTPIEMINTIESYKAIHCNHIKKKWNWLLFANSDSSIEEMWTLLNVQ